MLTKHWRRALAALLLGTVSPVSSFAWQDDSAKKTITYTLQHRQPADVYRALEPLIGDPQNCTIQTVDAQRQLIVTGPNWVHETAQEVIRQLEHADNNVRVEPELVVASYRCPVNELLQIEKRLAEEFQSNELSTSRLPGSEVLFIRTTRANHEKLSQWLQRSNPNPTQANANNSSPSPNSDRASNAPRPVPKNEPFNLPSTVGANPGNAIRPGSPGKSNNTNTPIANDPQATQLLRRSLASPAAAQDVTRRELAMLLSNRLRADIGNPNVLWLVTALGDARIHFDTNRNEIQIDGPTRVVLQIERLMVSMQNNRSLGSAGVQNRVLILRKDLQPGLIEPIAPISNPQQNARPDSTTLPSRILGIRQVSFTSPQDPVPTVTPPPPNTSGDQPPIEGDDRPRLPQFEGVQIESLPDLDTIILRGRNAELDQLTEIIKQLEQVSELTKPTVEIIPLLHANADRVAKLIEQTQVNLIGTRQGRATVTALVKPNAVMIIGWGDAVIAIKELISKLDQAVPSDSQFIVIRLKHATAATLQTTLQSFFASRQGLGPVIQATADARSNSLVVHGAPRDLEEVRVLVEQLDVPHGSSIQRARVFTIQHSLAADVAQTLQQAIQGTGTTNKNQAIELLDKSGNPLVASGVLDQTQITVNDRNNTLIVTAPIENLGLIEQLIQQLDTPGMVAKIKIFPVENGDAASLVEMLRALLPSQTNNTSVTQLSSSPSESSLVPLRFTVDTRGNNIVATGSEGDLKIVEALIFRLDESDGMQRRSTVYQLKNSPAIDVALAINEFLRNKRQVENAAPGQSNPFDQLEKEVVVVPEPVANKLILSATPRYYDEISDLIEKLDQQPPQVMIQVLIAEVALGQADEFGVELGLQDSVLFDRSLLGNIFTLTNTTTTSTPAGVVTDTQQTIVASSNDPGFNFNSTTPLGNSGSANSLATASSVGGQGISNFSVGRSNNELGFGGLVLSASSQNVSFLLRALQETRRLDVLSRPQILTLDNQPAFIQVGQRVPRIVGSTVNQNGQQNNITLENVGLIIGVTPRISPEGNVVMEIDAEKSSLGTEAEGIPVSVSNNGTIIRSPRIETTQAQATVSAADGETIILGGLITKSHRQQHRKVPILGDLPVLKHLFRFDSVIDRRTELLIVLTPHVVRSLTDMERLKEMEVARMSWCAADVFEVHGDIRMSAGWNQSIPSEGDWEIVYPDVDPRGTSSRRPAPTNNSQEAVRPTSAPSSPESTPGNEPNNLIRPAYEPQLSQGQFNYGQAPVGNWPNSSEIVPTASFDNSNSMAPSQPQVPSATSPSATVPGNISPMPNPPYNP